MLRFLLVLTAFTAAFAAPELNAIKRSTADETKRIWWDRGGLASDDFICWGPASPPGTAYKALGYRGQKNHDDIQAPIYGFILKNSSSNALKDATEFEFIWDDRRSINWNDGSLWRANCPTGYVAVGDFFYGANHITQPGQDIFHETKCVRKDLTAVCKIDKKVWDDSGSLASQDVSVWEATVDDTMLGGFLFGNSVHEQPPGIEGRCLLKSAFVEVLP